MAWYRVASIQDIAPGEMMAAKVGDADIALFNINGEIYATAGICTHAFAYLCQGYLDEHLVECPLHQGVFDVRTGAPIEGPVDEALQTYSVRLNADDIFIEI